MCIRDRIIPGYNVANFIVDTLHEVFNQCESNFEVIYVDDASNDNTLCLLYTSSIVADMIMSFRSGRMISCVCRASANARSELMLRS